MTRYTLHPQVGLRTEAVGALAYHYGNRRLTFLDDDRLVDVVRHGNEHTDVETALAAAGVPEPHWATYLRALDRLVASDVVRREDGTAAT
jgi:putative mycofactocin binding protein MftB